MVRGWKFLNQRNFLMFDCDKIPKMEVAIVWQMCYIKREGESQRNGLPSKQCATTL